jgi:hypothetical protein
MGMMPAINISFRKKTDLNVVVAFRLTREEALQKWKKIYYTRLRYQAFVKDALQSQVDQITCAFRNLLYSTIDTIIHS